MNIRTVRKKIKSVGNVKKITKAMQMVSAIKMKKSQAEAIESAPYRTHLANIIYKAMSSVDSGYSPLIENKKAKDRSLYIIISSNKGLCGSFNFNLFKYLNKNIDFKNNDFITYGKKASSFIAKMGGKIISDFSDQSVAVVVSPIFSECLARFLAGDYQKVMIVYNKFISTLKSETVETVLLPSAINEIKQDIKETPSEYLIEPNAKDIVDAVLRSLVEEKIRGALIESQASEHSFRMMAMKNATDNATDVIYNLTLLRNRIRQEKITYELLDMITAKESVESN